MTTVTLPIASSYDTSTGQKVFRLPVDAPEGTTIVVTFRGNSLSASMVIPSQTQTVGDPVDSAGSD